jgi:hypothetical protein
MRVTTGYWYHLAGPAIALCALLLLTACASAPLTQTGALSSYAELKRSDGLLTHAKLRADRDRLATAQTVRLAPAEISTDARFSGLSEAQLRLVANAVDRALCSGLSDRFTVVAANDPADLSVKTTITYVSETSVAASSASLAVSAGATIAFGRGGSPVIEIRTNRGDDLVTGRRRRDVAATGLRRSRRLSARQGIRRRLHQAAGQRPGPHEESAARFADHAILQ